MWYRYTALSLIVIWLIILTCQSLNILKFGNVVIPKSWVVYISLGVIGVVVLDYLGFMNKHLSDFIFSFMLIYNVVFNLVFAYDLYRFSPLYNRAEHFFGTILAAFIAYSFLSTRPFFTQIPMSEARVMFLVFFVITLGAANEIFELFMDLVFKTKNIGPDLFDTNWDLLTNFVGIGAFVIIGKLIALI